MNDSEAQFRSFVENSFDVIFILDASGIFRFVGPSWEQHFGYPASEVNGRPFAPVVHPDDVQPCFAYLQKVMSTGQPGTSPRYRVKCADGSWKLFIANGSRFIDAQGEVLFHGIGRDISEQQQMLDQVKASEEKFAMAFNRSPALMSISTIDDGCYLDVNDRFCAVSGLERHEIVGRTSVELGWLSAASRAQMKELLRRDGRVKDNELQLTRRDGTEVCVLFSAEIVTIDGQARLLAIALDITDRKKDLAELNYVNECFVQALTGSQHILYRLNVKKGYYDYLSPAFETITGHQVDGFRDNGLEQVMDFFHPDDRTAVFAAIDTALRTRSGSTVSFEFEYRIRKADGGYCWLHDSTTAWFSENGELELFFGSAYDITERKRTEVLLRESEERYRRFIATAYEGVSITDQDYTITYVNGRFAEMLGYEAHELIGINVSTLLHPEEHRSFTEQVAARKRGESSQRECWHLRKDGSKAWLLTSSAPIMDETGIFQGCFAMFTDLTKRREAEIALKQSYEELESKVAERTAALAEATEKITMMSFELIRAEEQERARIAAELHDHVGQSLLLAKIKSDTLASESQAGEERTAAADISALLENSIHDIRTLTFSMRPPLLDTVGVEAALEWLCASLQKNYTLQVDFSFNCRPLQLAEEKRYPLYLSIRELLLNVVKHAGVNRAELILSAPDGILEVRVIDKGAGFDQSDDKTSLAASGGFGLFSVQQRIEQLGGSFAVASTGAGTVVTLTVPLE